MSNSTPRRGRPPKPESERVERVRISMKGLYFTAACRLAHEMRVPLETYLAVLVRNVLKGGHSPILPTREDFAGK